MTLRKHIAILGCIVVLLHLCLNINGQSFSQLPIIALLSQSQLLERCVSMELTGLHGEFQSQEELAVTPSPSPTPVPSEEPAPKPTPEPPPAPNIKEAVIAGGINIDNRTDYEIDIAGLLTEGPSQKLQKGQPQILIIHTHSSEAYTMDDFDRYEASDNSRTQDPKYNVIRVGDALTDALRSHGLEVIHDREIHDYPSYTGSYTRTGEAISQYIDKYPSIALVIDVHRDAIGSGDVVYKTVAEGEGNPCAQTMFVVGSNASGLEHPNWKENLKLALYLQSAIHCKHPTLQRPVKLVQERYNQQLTSGSLILEVGSNGNTLQEALNAIELFAEAAGPALAELVE